MHRPSARHRRTVRRRRVAALVLLVAIGTPGAVLSLSAGSTVPRIKLLVDGDVVGSIDARLPLSTRARVLPGRATVRARGVTTAYAIDRRRAASRLARLKGSELTLPGRRMSVSIAAPAVAQRLRDNCETAALQVLLATKGVRIDQLVLQRRLRRSGPLDPEVTPAGSVWGDPDAGYVGRADGSGSWGGFGVYPGPIASLAARHGRRLRDLTGTSPSSLYRSVLGGRAVLAWVGLGDGPYREWTAPDGRAVSVNLNEHTVVLTGMRRDGSLELVNVLEGTREVWSRARFEQAWALLGQRALATT